MGYSSSSSDDIEELNYSEERRKVPPITANSHLYCHASTLHISSEALYTNMDPKTQKYKPESSAISLFTHCFFLQDPFVNNERDDSN